MVQRSSIPPVREIRVARIKPENEGEGRAEVQVGEFFGEGGGGEGEEGGVEEIEG